MTNEGEEMVIELKDGSLITPMSVFDVLDVVEEYLGTDLRQYLEDWFENDREELTEDERFDELKEHYVSVLETAEYELGQLPRQKKKEQAQTLERVQELIRRAIHGKEDV